MFFYSAELISVCSINEVCPYATRPRSLKLTCKCLDEVWSKKAKANIIVSYLQGYQVPPVVLRTFIQQVCDISIIHAASKGKMTDGTYECIDGKQRLTSLCQ